MKAMRTAALVLATAAAAVLPAAGSATASAPADTSHCKTVQMKQNVAVHYDPSFDSRVVRTARKGSRETVCLTAIGRGNAYRVCGASGYDWYMVRGGFIPDVCARTVRS